MNKVTTISLDGRSYQIEESGYEALHRYLERARAGLTSNPDQAEIMADLERAIGEKLARFLTAHKNVVTASEAEQAIAEMGPVDSSTGSEQGEPAPIYGEQGRAKRLYRIPEGAKIAGVASGLAAYFDVDVTLIRVLFVALTILTGGVWVAVYIALVIFIPRADTPEQVSRAHGEPFNAQEIIDRARAGYEDIRKNAWQWREEQWRWRHSWKNEARRMKWEARRAKWEARGAYGYRCHTSLIGELFQLAFLALIIWAVYHWLPGTQPFFNHVWALIQQGWAWIFQQLAK